MGDENNKSDGEVAGATTTADDKKNGSSNKEDSTTNDSAGGGNGDAKSDAPTETPSTSGDVPAEGGDDASPEKDDGSKQNTSTEAGAAEGTPAKPDGENKPDTTSSSTPNANAPIVSSSKKSRPPYKYDPDKITLRFLFANRDGLTVTVECRPGDTVGEVKGALLSVWPSDLPGCSGGDRLRLVCMGKGILMPDTRTLEDCQIPVFKTHPTPVNVSVKPEVDQMESAKSGNDGNNRRTNTTGGSPGAQGEQTSQGCACVIL